MRTATPYNFSSNFMFRSSHLAFACSRKSTVPVARDGPETPNQLIFSAPNATKMFNRWKKFPLKYFVPEPIACDMWMYSTQYGGNAKNRYVSLDAIIRCSSPKRYVSL